MPKIVDHDERKKLIAEATWRVILKRGMEGATVRNIAEEAGLSLGALRHYFSTQTELIIYAMKLVKEKANARIIEIAMQDLPTKEKVLRILLELVPTNEETMAEMEVWFAFTAHARHHEDLFDAQHDGIFTGVKKLLIQLEKEQLLREDIEIELEAEKLYALIDGIALHAMLEPGRVHKDRIIAVLTHYLDSICK